jgi:hypothetical protein
MVDLLAMLYVLAALIVTLGLYFALGLRRFVLLVLIPCIIGATIYASWYYFSGQYEKDRSADKKRISEEKRERDGKKHWENLLDDTRRIERNVRSGYRYEADPTNTSPLGVLRFEAREYDKFNDEDLLSMCRDRYYPTIPKEKFDQWARDPYGQEKIDAYLEDPLKLHIK